MTVDEQAAGAKRTPQPVHVGDAPGHRAFQPTSAAPHAAPGFDIGVVSGSPHTKATGPGRRRLPVWVFAGMALLVGWLLGSLLGSSDPQPPAAREAAGLPAGEAQTNGAAAPQDVEQAPSERSSASVEATLPLPGATLVLAVESDARAGDSIAMIDAFATTRIWLGESDGAASSDVGPQHRVLSIGDRVVFVEDGTAFQADVRTSDSAVALAQADRLMAGTGPGNLWAIRGASRTVQLRDLGSQSVQASYDLSAIGEPVASYDGGLIVAPDIEWFGPFALWSPARGIERIWSVDVEATFIDAAANVIVLQTAQGLASYNTVTGSLTQTDRTLTASQLETAKVSPDGVMLAVFDSSNDGQVSELEIVALSSGQLTDRFQASRPEIARWVSDDQVLHLAAEDTLQVVLRDTTLGFGTKLFVADSEIRWMTLND